MSQEMLERTNAYCRQRFEEVVAEGCRWLVECTDDYEFGIPGDDYDDGVFFMACKTDADVDALIEEYEGTLNTCRDVIDLQTPYNEHPGPGKKFVREFSVEEWKNGKR